MTPEPTAIGETAAGNRGRSHADGSHHAGLARDVVANMARNDPGRGVVAAAAAETNLDGQLLALVKIGTEPAFAVSTMDAAMAIAATP